MSAIENYPNLKKAKAARRKGFERRVSRCEAYLKTLNERPHILDICKLFALHFIEATKLIDAEFGKRVYLMPEVRRYIGTLTERPLCKTIASKFGISRQCACVAINEKFGSVYGKSARLRRWARRQESRPSPKAAAKKYGVSEGWARQVIHDVWGDATYARGIKFEKLEAVAK